MILISNSLASTTTPSSFHKIESPLPEHARSKCTTTVVVRLQQQPVEKEQQQHRCHQQGKRRRLRTSSALRRRVRFNDQVFEANDQNDCNSENNDCSLSWYADEDYAQFKKDLNHDARMALKRYKALQCQGNMKTCPIRQAHEKITAAAAAGHKKKSRQSNDLVLIQELNLVFYTHCVDELLGLEEMVSKQIHSDKHFRRQLLLAAVEEIQMPQVEWSSDDLRAAVLRRVCQDISGPSRLFALYVGRASLAAALSQE
ncbi:hypothetical protein ACA910_020872 [Epithemia clementina (nom. ined.)]